MNCHAHIADFSESKIIALDNLQNYPNCQKYRKTSIWGIEFFDPLFTNPQDDISFYIDADILFMRTFSRLFDKNEVKDGAIFLSDTQWDAYCLRPWKLLSSRPKAEIVKGITTGLVFWDKGVIDWDYLEWFLGAHHLHHIPEWIIPTAQAGLANRCKSKTISSRQITNLYPNAHIYEDTFGLHLLGSYRREWLEKLKPSTSVESHLKNLPTIVPCFEKCVNQNIFGYSHRQIRRWKNTRLNLW